MNRRAVLKAGLVLAASSHTAVATAETSPVAHITVDAFLIKATAAERVRYHANALAEAMNEIHPGQYVVTVDHDVRPAMVFDRNGGKAVLA